MIKHFNSQPMFSLSASSRPNVLAMTSGCFDPDHANVKTVYDQAVNTFAVLDKQLLDLGLTKSDILGADVWLPLRAKTEGLGISTICSKDAQELNQAWQEYFDGHIKPTRATVGVGFVVPTFLVEIRFYLAR